MALRIENGKANGSITLNTTVEPTTKSNPTGRNIVIRNFTIELKDVPEADLRKKLEGQVGIDFRARVRPMKAEEIRAYSGLTLDWKEFYTTSRASARPMTTEEMIAALKATGMTEEQIIASIKS